MSVLGWFKRSLGSGGPSEVEAPSADSGADVRGAEAAEVALPGNDPAAPPIGTVEVGSATESASPTAPSDSGDDILSALKAKIAELSNGQLPEEDLDANAMLFDFGYVDSLSAVTLISFVDSRYGVAVTELDLVGAINNLQLLADHIQTQRRG